MPKKPKIRDKNEPLSSQKVGLKSKKIGVTWHVYLITPFGMGKC
jgi:hypothetical protein